MDRMEIFNTDSLKSIGALLLNEFVTQKGTESLPFETWGYKDQSHTLGILGFSVWENYRSANEDIWT